MKLITPILLLACFSSFGQITGNSDKINESTKPKFALKSGIINYEISGDGTGTVTLHFDRNGWRKIEHRHLTIEKYGVTSTEQTVELVDGDYVYKANLDSKKGQKQFDKSWSGLLNYKSKEETISAIMTTKGGTKDSTEVLLDKTCTIWKFDSGTISELWEWEGIPLKVVKRLPGISYEITATSIDELDSIPEERLQSLEPIVWSN